MSDLRRQTALSRTNRLPLGSACGDSRSSDEAPFLSVVSPVYMAEKILPVLCERLDQVLSAITDSYEIILVCDGSPDASWSVLEDMVARYHHVTAIKLSRNFGQHYAMTAGFDFAHGQWTVVMDCDLQDAPEEIPRLLAKAQEGYDIVVARRIARKHKWWKRVTSKLFFKVFSLLSGLKTDSAVGSFRIMSRPVVDGLCDMRESYRMFAGLVEWLGFHTGYLDVQHAARFEGESSYNLRRLLRMAMDGLISFSNRPLYISIGLGFALSLLSGLYGAYLLLGYFIVGGSPVSGWLSTITATSFLGGLILLNQGVLGIYLGRVYNQAKGRPLYVVDKISIGSKAGVSSNGRASIQDITQ
ncbi:MAG: glycosyltransferase family 2 protein [Pseudomonadales bacterium]|nr:glycosyltransferase family 2 protein [Pseudomonadales bacterium]